MARKPSAWKPVPARATGGDGIRAAHTSFPAVKTIEGEIEWEDLKHYSFEQLKWMPGLGASQKGEVAYLKKQGIGFMRVDVTEGAPTAEQTERMLVEHAEALDLGTAEGREELRPMTLALISTQTFAWLHQFVSAAADDGADGKQATLPLVEVLGTRVPIHLLLDALRKDADEW